MRYAKGRARREEILRVALEIFASQGYCGASLTVIARQVGLSEAGVLRHRMIFLEDAVSAVTPLDPETVPVGDSGLCTSA
jgi:hypothetical protein